MERTIQRFAALEAWAALGVLVGTGLLLLTGCGREASSPAADSLAGTTARGEAIRGEPLTRPASNAPQAPAPVPTSPAQPAQALAASGSALPSVSSVSSGTSAEAPSPGTPEHPLAVGFDKLASFQYTVPDGAVETNEVALVKTASQIPPAVKALNNQFVSLKGFMLPLRVEKGLVTEFLLMRDQSMCCYGSVPKINEWVSVKMVGSGLKPNMDQAATYFGKLKVGEIYENGYLVGIYAMDGERMAGPLDL